MKLFRSGWWPGPKPTIQKDRKMCSDCIYHSAAMAGWQYDRCSHPDADYGSVVRNDQAALCYDMRNSSAQCGNDGKWFEPRLEASNQAFIKNTLKHFELATDDSTRQIR